MHGGTTASGPIQFGFCPREWNGFNVVVGGVAANRMRTLRHREQQIYHQLQIYRPHRRQRAYQQHLSR